MELWFDCKLEIEGLKLPIEGFSLQFSVYTMQMIEVLVFFQFPVGSLQFAARSPQLPFSVEFPN